MNHLDLFSGIGGFATAVDEVWPGSTHTFCEIDPYCRALLKKRFEGSKIYGDIRTLRLAADSDSDGRTGWQKEVDTDKTGEQALYDTEKRNGTDLLTGGFPCQPFSQAGKRKGVSDNRFLWPEMLRVIRDFKPTWVIAENVRGLLTIEQGVVFEQVCTDLEGEGYDVQAFVIPAVSLNAPHRRDRVWFVAHHHQCRSQVEGAKFKTERDRQSYQNAPDAQEQRGERDWGTRNGRARLQDSSWNQNWLEVATELCGVDDGLPAELDGLVLTKARHRVERLKSLGNAIVPAVAIEIMRAIKHSS